MSGRGKGGKGLGKKARLEPPQLFDGVAPPSRIETGGYWQWHVKRGEWEDDFMKFISKNAFTKKQFQVTAKLNWKYQLEQDDIKCNLGKKMMNFEIELYSIIMFLFELKILIKTIVEIF